MEIILKLPIVSRRLLYLGITNQFFGMVFIALGYVKLVFLTGCMLQDNSQFCVVLKSIYTFIRVMS